MDIPKNIEDWSEKTIKDLLQIQYQENDLIEYKSVLKPGKTDEEKWGYQAIFTSFANSQGGFVIFGIKQTKDSPPTIELCGVDVNGEPNLLISSFTQAITPQLRFETKLITIDGKTVLVVKVKESTEKPISCSNSSYYLRLNGGKVPMPRYMVADYFISNNSKRLQKNKLIFEIDLMIDAVKGDLNYSATPNFFSYRNSDLINAITDSSGFFNEKEALDLIKAIIDTINRFELFKQWYLDQKDMIARYPHVIGPQNRVQDAYHEKMRSLDNNFNGASHADFRNAMKNMLPRLKTLI